MSIETPYIWDSVKPGFQFRLIKNPDYPRKSLDEFIKIAEYSDETQNKWLILIYQGKNPSGYRCPENILPSKWEPEFNSWRNATKKEIKFLIDSLKRGKYKVLQSVRTKEKLLETIPGEESKFGDIEIPYSNIYYFPERNVIMKKLRIDEIREEEEKIQHLVIPYMPKYEEKPLRKEELEYLRKSMRAGYPDKYGKKLREELKK